MAILNCLNASVCVCVCVCVCWCLPVYTYNYAWFMLDEQKINNASDFKQSECTFLVTYYKNTQLVLP